MCLMVLTTNDTTSCVRPYRHSRTPDGPMNRHSSPNHDTVYKPLPPFTQHLPAKSSRTSLQKPTLGVSRSIALSIRTGHGRFRRRVRPGSFLDLRPSPATDGSERGARGGWRSASSFQVFSSLRLRQVQVPSAASSTAQQLRVGCSVEERWRVSQVLIEKKPAVA